MWYMNSINEGSCLDFKESPVLWRCCWRFALTNAKGSFESGKFTLNITCEGGKLFTTGCRLPPKSTNFGTLALFDTYGATHQSYLMKWSCLTGQTILAHWRSEITGTEGNLNAYLCHVYMDKPALGSDF